MTKKSIKLGADQATIMLIPTEKVGYDEWEFLVDTMLERFIDLSKFSILFPKMKRIKEKSIPNGYTSGLEVPDEMLNFKLCWHETRQDMGIYAHFTATAWHTYQNVYED